MALFRAQAHRLLQRMQGLCGSAEASSGGMLHPSSLLQPSRPRSSAAASVQAGAWLLQGQSADVASPQHIPASSTWQWGRLRDAEAVMPPSGAPTLWAPHGLHNLQPAIAAALASSASLHGPHITCAAAPLQQQLPAASEHSPPERGGDATYGPAGDGTRISGVMELVKREYQPSVIIRKRRHGFLARLRSKGGQKVLQRRKLRGRWKKTA